MNKKSLRDVLNVRRFESGAIRDTDIDKIDYEGHLNPLVLQRFAQYMHEHRQTAAGPRASDDWQRGMPTDVYMKSMHRHFMDVWISHRYPEVDIDVEDALCGMLFNAMGYLLEVLNAASSPAVHVNRAMDLVTREFTERIMPRHAVSVEQPPWVIQTVMSILDPRQYWYTAIGVNGLYMLNTWVAKGIGPAIERPLPELDGFYTYVPEALGWLLDISKCPPDTRDRWKMYPEERTEAEIQELLWWERHLYELKNDRYLLKSPYKAWARGE